MDQQAEQTSLFEGYQLGAAWDEMLSEPGAPRTPYKAVHRTLAAMSSTEMLERADQLARNYLDQGVTFDHSGEEQPFPLDAVPRVLSAHEWEVIEAGVVQRVTALEALLDDIYSREVEIPRAVHEGIVPWRLIASSAHFHRAATGIRPTNGVRIHVSGIDLIRDEQRHLPGAGGQRPGAVGRQLRDRQPPSDGQRLPRGVRDDADPPGRTTTPACCFAPSGPPPPTAPRTPTSWCSPRASTTAPTSSTPCSRG